SYCGPFEYANGSLSRVNFPGGYVKDGVAYHYIHDHQGNVRQVVEATTGKVVQENHYYPGGMLFAESTATYFKPGTSGNTYRYGGKEFLTADGLNLSLHGARMYDPALLRFITPDPLRHQTPHLSPYLYCAANPVMYVDPTGMSIFDFCLGVITSISDNILGGNTSIRDSNSDYIIDTEDYNAGLATGDSGSIILGGIMVPAGNQFISSGIATIAGGTLASIPSGGTSLTLVGAGAIETGIGAAISYMGARMLSSGAKNMSENKGHLDSSTIRPGQVSNGNQTITITTKKGRITIKVPKGYRLVKGHTNSNQKILYNGKNYITPDVDKHVGGVWKSAKTKEALNSKSTRLGTYDEDLNWIGK
ncbi:MAG: toxin C-terminal domain-containing protein, partial [Muribaculaceae bacterium]|nr:toxin C-terminal domain-containing protein [Muribaculaceae bacterium]